MPRDLSHTALLVIDLQTGFDDPNWGRRNNPECEANVVALVTAWQTAGRPVVYVRHDSVNPQSPLRPELPGNALRPELPGDPDVLITKNVNSAFFGDPDLHGWLQDRDVTGVAVTGVQTNFCCETTARMAGNLGYETLFVLDATHTFDLPAYGGGIIPADELARVTASNLRDEFAEVVSTQELL
jgi:nicotinamidase-related amidase